MINSRFYLDKKVYITLKVEDNENKNVEFPRNELQAKAFSNDEEVAFVFSKIDPSKDTWGDISIDFRVEGLVFRA